MESSSSQDRSQPASPRKLKKAREEGQVARSRDLGHFAALCTGAVAIAIALPMVSGQWIDKLSRLFSFNASLLAHPAAMTETLQTLVWDGLLVILPFASLIILAGVASSLAVGGWTFSWKAVMPAFSKISPLAGVGRLFSRQQLLDTVKMVVLALVLCAVGWFYLAGHYAEFTHGLTVSLPQSLEHGGAVLSTGAILLLLVLALTAAVDAPLQRMLHLSRLKMSHQDLKQENRESNGNPQLKAKLRQRQREIAGRRMMAAVPKADLIVVNPTHYAVALRYDEATMKAPQVVAKGADLLALQIRKLAQGAKVPVLESPRLARALFAHARIDQEIPSSLYTAVAQVLAYVYQLRAALARGLPVPSSVPDPFVPKELDPHETPTPSAGNA